MTVQELIDELRDYDPGTLVVLPAHDHSYRKVGSVRLEPAEVHPGYIGEWYDDEQGTARWVVVVD